MRNCTWGTVSANEIMDSGAGGRRGENKYHIYMHTDVKGIQITGNRLFCWADQLPTKAGIFEGEDCRDNNIVANSINYFTEQAVISKGKNSVTANNLVQPRAYPNPTLQPFAKPRGTYMRPQGPVRYGEAGSLSKVVVAASTPRERRTRCQLCSLMDEGAMSHSLP